MEKTTDIKKLVITGIATAAFGGLITFFGSNLISAISNSNKVDGIIQSISELKITLGETNATVKNMEIEQAVIKRDIDYIKDKIE
jgi:5-bromo-4-chloroindolyl phosphate hydrolysis protein